MLKKALSFLVSFALVTAFLPCAAYADSLDMGGMGDLDFSEGVEDDFGFEGGETPSQPTPPQVTPDPQPVPTPEPTPVPTPDPAPAPSVTKPVLRSAKVSLVKTNSAKISWSACTNAAGYRIYKYNASTGKYVLKMTIQKKGTLSWTPKGLAAGSRHVYRVNPYVLQNGQKVNGTGKIVRFNTKPNQVLGVKLTKPTKGKVKVTWNKRVCTGYQICYSKKANFSGQKTVKVTKAGTLTKTLTGLTSGKTYYVKVRAYKTSSNTTISYGAWSAPKKIVVK